MRTRTRAAALAGAAVLAAGCSSAAAGSGVAALGSAKPSASASAAAASGIAFSRCMRAHGVPKFPDPNAHGGIDIDAGKLGITPGSPVFAAADRACAKLRPGGGAPPNGKASEQGFDAALAYAKCMRTHGIPAYPDPTRNGAAIAQMLPPSVDPHSPQFTAADKKCHTGVPGSGPGGAPPGGSLSGSGTSDGGAADGGSS